MLKLILILGFATASLASAAGEVVQIDYKKINFELSLNKAILLDVREAEEIVEGMAKPAIWLSTIEIQNKSNRSKEIFSHLNKSRKIYVYCAVGGRAGLVVGSLRRKGYQAENIGGFFGWKAAKLPIVFPKSPQTAPCPYLCGNL